MVAAKLVEVQDSGKPVLWKGMNVQKGYPVCDEYELVMKDEIVKAGIRFFGIQSLYKAFSPEELRSMQDQKWQGLHVGAISKYMDPANLLTLSSVLTQKLLDEIC